MDDGIGKCAACGSTHCIIEAEGVCHDCMPGVRWERERLLRDIERSIYLRIPVGAVAGSVQPIGLWVAEAMRS